MTQTLNCTITPKPINFDIIIGSHILEKQIPYLKTLGSRFALITDNNVASQHGHQLHAMLSSHGLVVDLVTFPAGEQHKTRETKAMLEDSLFQKGCGRDTCILALGGGVVTDLVGFVAATYGRGVPLVMIPTSLMGMVDASVGGKTGVDLSYGKNLVGCIYQPKRVIVELDMLDTLPKRELINGVVEMIKHGLIADCAFFDLLEKDYKRILAMDKDLLAKMIYQSCGIKLHIVQHDERENGMRRLLNFGHTIGHALEKLSNYTLSHGEAVAIGIVVESDIATKMGYLNKKTFERIQNIFKLYDVPMRLPESISVDAMLDAMVHDKKSLGGMPRFVMIDAIGSTVHFGTDYCTPVNPSLIKEAMKI